MKQVLSIVAAAGVLMFVGNTAAEAKGCLKGALVGGVAGHYMHRHTLLGAAAGCIIGHHLAHKKEQEQKAAAEKAKQQQQQQSSHW
jgi:outer membrane lipoprotein SlyB